jgi:serine/threonine protein kinase
VPNVKSKRLTRRNIKIAEATDSESPTESGTESINDLFPNFNDYFVSVPSNDSCAHRFLKPGPKRIVPFVQLRMNHSGIKLSEYALNIPNLINNWIHIQIHLAEGLRMLHTRKYVYGDFHFANILVDEKARLVDFGVFTNLNTLVEKDIAVNFLPVYDNHAPELDIISGLHSNFGTTTEVITEIYNKKSILKEIEEVFPSQRDVYSELIGFVHSTDLTTASDALVFIKHWGCASDMWIFGFDFYKLYMLMLALPLVLESNFYKRSHSTQMKIFRGLLHPDPRKRSTVDDVLTELYTLRMMV